MSNQHETPRNRGAMTGWLILGGTALGVLALGILATTILERREEATFNKLTIKQPITQWESDSSKWGINFPREYDTWRATAIMDGKTEFAGSVERDHLANNPRLVVLWAGYAFAKGYNAPRGHMHAVDDVRNTPRRNEKTVATCWTCKSPDVPRVMARDGVKEYYAHNFDHYQADMKNPIGCADCHNEKTMALQISRPALKEALQRQGEDIAKITHQEMRSLVCAQCHVEYYFKGKEAHYLTFPWDDGLTAEAMAKYYADNPHTDWVHAISGAKMIKMQHPDYEVYMQGIHAVRGVSCADCHMPYKQEGGVKFSDHQIQSPLLNVENSCQVCHKWGEKDIKNRVFSMQRKHHEMSTQTEDALVNLHLAIGEAAAKGATPEQLAKPRELVSLAQMYWDYVSANNGMGFHAPQETARVLSKALAIASEGRLILATVRGKLGLGAIAAPADISTKEKAQAFIKPFVSAQKAKLDAEELAKKKLGSKL
ncbi:MAG: ammonia-forming cytochrome c nitrite reductase subunit c552 [Chthonomonas sp.]|nr:ammonia-forming cytochrome c nitrite reductase subunit c552 [Chthonomonas sp.]